MDELRIDDDACSCFGGGFVATEVDDESVTAIFYLVLTFLGQLLRRSFLRTQITIFKAYSRNNC
jgi:hypothetical protein